MIVTLKIDPRQTAQVLDLVAQERTKALSRREWQHRLAGYGYGIRATQGGDIIETLPHHVVVCRLPPDLCA